MNKIVDRSQVDAMLEKLSPENRNKIMMQALKKGATTLKQQAESELTKTGIRYNTPSRFTGKTLLSGIRLKADNAYSEVKVHIMGDFRLKFFEKGTKQRQTKKHSNKGTIKATHFFSKARQNETKIKQVITELLDKKL